MRMLRLSKLYSKVYTVNVYKLNKVSERSFAIFMVLNFVISVT